jgi:hypothetical protein
VGRYRIHVSLVPIRPKAAWLNYDDMNVPIRRDLLRESFRETLQGLERIVNGLIVNELERRGRTKFARIIVCH